MVFMQLELTILFGRTIKDLGFATPKPSWGDIAYTRIMYAPGVVGAFISRFALYCNLLKPEVRIETKIYN